MSGTLRWSGSQKRLLTGKTYEIRHVLNEASKTQHEGALHSPAFRPDRIQMNAQKVPSHWVKWCTTGKHGIGNRKKNAVLKCLKSGHVRGYFSDLPLKPDLEPSHSMSPSFDHLDDPSDHQQAVVEARIINTMKSHMTEDEFWRVIEHLFVVGVEKGKIKAPFGKRLPNKWSPARHYGKVIASAPQNGVPLPVLVSKAA